MGTKNNIAGTDFDLEHYVPQIDWSDMLINTKRSQISKETRTKRLQAGDKRPGCTGTIFGLGLSKEQKSENQRKTGQIVKPTNLG
jgi:hypothetical protein